jgi:hypothetical protein
LWPCRIRLNCIDEDFDLAYADTGLNSHVNIFNLYGPYSS